MKRHAKAGRHDAHDEETREAHLVQVFRVKEEVGDAQVFPKIPGDHGEQNNPAKHENNIPPDII